MKAAETLIAWNDGAGNGAVAVGPLIEKGGADWTAPYRLTGGAAYAERRDMIGREQTLAVMADWFALVYGYGVHPVVAHQAFQHIDEYREFVNEIGHGLDRLDYLAPDIATETRGQVVHAWIVPGESK